MRIRKKTFLCFFLFGCLWLPTTGFAAGPITVTGEGRVPVTLTPARAERFAQDMAQRDARRKILLSAYGKPVPQGARLVGELRNVAFSKPERFEKEGRQMMRVVARIAATDVREVRAVVDDRVDVRIDAIVAGSMESHQPLINGGAHIFWGEKNEWLKALRIYQA